MKIVTNLKSEIKSKQEEFKSNPDKLDEVLFESILQRRILLTKKILLLYSYNEIIRKTYTNTNQNHCEENKENNKESIINNINSLVFLIEGEKYNIKQLIWSIKFCMRLYNDSVSPSLLNRTKQYLDKNFNYETYKIKEIQEIEQKAGQYHQCNISNFTLSSTNDELKSTSEISILLESNVSQQKKYIESQIEKVNQLQKEKDNLEKRKKSAEKIMKILKTFIILRENSVENRIKYKIIINFLITYKNGKSIEEISFDFIKNAFENEEFIIGLFEEVSIKNDEGQEIDIYDDTPSMLSLVEMILNNIHKKIQEKCKEVLEDYENETSNVNQNSEEE